MWVAQIMLESFLITVIVLSQQVKLPSVKMGWHRVGNHKTFLSLQSCNSTYGRHLQQHSEYKYFYWSDQVEWVDV